MSPDHLIVLLASAIGPVLGTLSGLWQLLFGDRELQKLSQLTDLHLKLPPSAQAESAELILERYRAYAARKRRKLDLMSLGTLLVVFVVGSGATYGLVMLASTLGGFFQWLINIIAIIVGLFAFGLCLYGATQLYVSEKAAK